MVFILDLKSPVETKRVPCVTRIETVEASSIGKALRFEIDISRTAGPNVLLVPWRRVVGIYSDEDLG